MVKEDIHNLSGVLDRTSERWILKLHPEDYEDVRRFTNDLLAGGYSAARVIKYFTYLAIIRKTLNKSFREANENDFKRFVAQLEKSSYAEWTKVSVHRPVGVTQRNLTAKVAKIIVATLCVLCVLCGD